MKPITMTIGLFLQVALLTTAGFGASLPGPEGLLEDRVGEVAIELDASTHASRIWPQADMDQSSSITSQNGRPRLMRRHAGSLEPGEDGVSEDLFASDDSVASGPDWKMKTECCGVFACAVEGGDCCCKGEVRLGKDNPNGVSHWTPWKKVDHWVSCDASVLGDPNKKEKNKYCECKGYCPVKCESPKEVVEAVPNINGTACAEEGKSYSPGDKCTLQCKSGYKPTTTALQCRTDRFNKGEHTWSPRKFSCEGVPCAAPTWVKNAIAPACAEGSHVLHGSTCAPTCKTGYIASAAVLSCQFGMLSPPDFVCTPMACGVKEGWILNQDRKGPCKEGDLIKSGSKCHSQCKEGFVPSIEHLSCEKGTFTPAKFTCREAPCSVPLGVKNALPSPCKESWSTYTSSGIPSGKVCTTKCKTGYKPSAPELNCSMGRLTPLNFECLGMSCPAPSNIKNGAKKACKEGVLVDHDFACTPQCAEGYEPSVTSLSCAAGTLSPPSFSCHPAPCQLPAVDHAPKNVCSNRSSKTLPHGESCATTCNEGFVPTHSVLKCDTGAFSPSTFKCEPRSCKAPSGIAHSSDLSCAEGRHIVHGTACTPKCEDGFTASEESLTCVRGSFRPRAFTCKPTPCKLPTSILHAARPVCTGFESSDKWVLSSGVNCKPRCRHKYVSSATSLSCLRGRLSPPTFECRRERDVPRHLAPKRDREQETSRHQREREAMTAKHQREREASKRNQAGSKSRLEAEEGLKRDRKHKRHHEEKKNERSKGKLEKLETEEKKLEQKEGKLESEENSVDPKTKLDKEVAEEEKRGGEGGKA